MTATTEALVDIDWVSEHLSDEDVRLIEVDVVATAYREGHIPGGLLWNIYADLRRPDYSPASTAEIEALVSRSGLTTETTAVFYGYGAHLGYWLLQSYGHQRAFVLDGPRDQWLDAGHAWSRELPSPKPTSRHLIRPFPRLHPDRETVAAMIGKPGRIILDVRSHAEYDGQRFWPSGCNRGRRAARSHPRQRPPPDETLRSPGGRFESDDRIREVLLGAGITPAHRIVTYCTVGNRAAQAWFALDRLDYPDAGVYAGSWAEWGLRTRYPSRALAAASPVPARECGVRPLGEMLLGRAARGRGPRGYLETEAEGAPLRETVWSARRLARKLARVAVAMGTAVEPQLRGGAGCPNGY